jgi:gustatory receptor
MGDLQAIKILFKIGHILALTPSSPTNAESSRFEKIYKYAVFTTCTLFKFFTWYNTMSVYVQLPKIQLFFTMVTEVTLCSHCYYTTMVVTNEHWYQLIDHLSRVESQSSREPRVLTVLVPLLAVGVVKVAELCYWSNSYGFVALGLCFVEAVQKYSQFFYITATYTILRMVLARYQYQNLLRRNERQPTRFRHNLHELKRLSCAVDDMFGWSILLHICFIVPTIMVYFHFLMRSSTVRYTSKLQYLHLVQNVAISVKLCEFGHSLFHLLPWFQIGVLWIIVLCDAVQQEYEKILQSFNKNSALYHMVLQTRPRFTAARFFSLQKSTIFSILNTLVTFSLVIIQIDL